MTRINATIPPKKLCDQMLLAEHREIVRIPNTINSGKAVIKDIPEDFSLGKGHVKFFYNKLQYLHIRYIEIYEECIKRGFAVSNFEDAFFKLDFSEYGYLYKKWNPLVLEIQPILIERINKRLSSMKVIRYYGKEININQIKL